MSNGYISTCRFTSWFWTISKISILLLREVGFCQLVWNQKHQRVEWPAVGVELEKLCIAKTLPCLKTWVNSSGDSIKKFVSRIVSTKVNSFKSPCPAWKKNNFLPRHRMLPTCQMRIQHQWWPDWQLWRHPYRCQGVAVLTYFRWGSRFGAWISQIHRCLYIVVYLYPTKNLWFHLWHHSDAGRLCQVTTLGGCAIGRYCRGTLPGGKKCGRFCSSNRLWYVCWVMIAIVSIN